MRRMAACLLILLTLVSVTACSRRTQLEMKIVSVAELPLLEVAPGTSLADYDLPTKVEVAFGDGRTELADVAWDTSGIVLHPDSQMELSGRVSGTDLPAKLKICVDIWAERPRPRLTADELARDDVADVMEEKVRSLHPEYREGWAWSPDGQTLAYVTLRSLYLWSVGSAEPSVVAATENTGIGVLNYPSWSHDGRYLAVQVNLSWEGQLLIIGVSDLQLTSETWVLGRAFWSPTSNQLLVACDSGIAPSEYINLSYTSDLVLLDAESGERRILLKADDQTLYLAAGWAAPGQALYYVGLDYAEKLALTVEE